MSGSPADAPVGEAAPPDGAPPPTGSAWTAAPPEPSRAEPSRAEPSLPQPPEPSLAQPAEPSLAQPAEPSLAQPAEPSLAQPAEPALAQPSLAEPSLPEPSSAAAPPGELAPDVVPARSAQVSPAPRAGSTGFVLGDLLVGEVLGRGATGEVRRAVGPDGEAVAVKLLRPELADEPQVVARLLRECQVVARLASPRAVRIHRLVAEGDRVGIVMDLLPDGDLRAWLRREGALTPADAARLTGQILLGLDHAHAAGIVHRDVKPENVLLRGRDAVLTDFGVARQLEGPALTRSTGLLGTPAYLAPELASHEPPTPAVDVYSAGCLLYELLTGMPPFVGGPAVAVLLRHLNETPARPDGVPDALWDALAAMVAKDPAERPTARDAAAVLAALAPALTDLPAHPWTPPPPAGRAGRTPARVAAPPPESGVGPVVPASTASPAASSAAQVDLCDPAAPDDSSADDSMSTRTSGPRGPYAPTAPAHADAPLPTLAAGDGAGDDFDAFATRTSARRRDVQAAAGPGPARPRRRRLVLPRRAALLIPIASVLVLALAGTGLAALLHHDGQAGLAADTTTVTATPSPTASNATPSPALSSDPAAGSATPTESPTPSAPGTSAAPPAVVAPPAAAPAAPSVTAAPISGAVVLAITQPSGGGPVTGYRISATGLSSRNATAAGQVVVPVPDCDRHTFTVTAVGPGGGADAAPVTAAGCVPPGPVTGVTAVVDQLADGGGGTVTVRWSAPADFGGASSVDYVLTITPDNPQYPPYTKTASGTVHVDCMPAGRCPTYVTAIQARNAVGLGPKVAVPHY